MSLVIKNVVASLYCQSGNFGAITRRLTTGELTIGTVGFLGKFRVTVTDGGSFIGSGLTKVVCDAVGGCCNIDDVVGLTDCAKTFLTTGFGCVD